MDFGKKLGEGNFGEVYEYGQDNVIKIFYNTWSGFGDIVGLAVKEKLQSDHIQRVFQGTKHGKWFAKVSKFGISPKDNKPYLISPKMTGSLDSLIVASNENKEQLKAMIFDSLNAIRLLHRRGITHNDFNPKNVLIDTVGQIKIADWGMMKSDTDRASQIKEFDDFAGSLQDFANGEYFRYSRVPIKWLQEILQQFTPKGKKYPVIATEEDYQRFMDAFK